MDYGEEGVVGRDYGEEEEEEVVGMRVCST